MAPNKDVVSFRSSDLKSQLLERGNSAGAIANRDLTRYYNLLRGALRTVQLSAAETSLLVDAFNGRFFGGFEISPQQYLRHEIEDAIRLDQLDQKWGIDRDKLMDKINTCSPIQAAAMIDAVEKFWYEPESCTLTRSQDR